MAFPGHLGFERIAAEFDEAEFRKGKAIASGLVGCVAKARMSGVDSMKPFWIRSSPAPSVISTSSHTSASEYYSGVKDISTPWHPCVILQAVADPWFVGIMLKLLPIARINPPDCFEWPPIVFETKLPVANYYAGIGYSFTMRCRVSKANVDGRSGLSSEQLKDLLSLVEASELRRRNDPGYPFSLVIHHYGELSSLVDEDFSSECIPWNDFCGWNRENTAIAVYLKRILDEGRQATCTDTLDQSLVFDSTSDHVIYDLVSILFMPIFADILSLRDCSVLSLTHPSLTRPCQRLMLRRLQIRTNVNAQQILGTIQHQHDLLSLIDAIHIDTCSSEAPSTSAYLSLVQSISPWVSEITIICNEPVRVVYLFDGIGFTPGLQMMTLASKTTSPNGPALPFPLYWMQHNGLLNLKHISLTGVTVSFNSATKWLSAFETFELVCCHLYAEDEHGDVNEVSLLLLLGGSVSTLRSLMLVSVTGILPASIPETFASSNKLQYVHISNVCSQVNPPISLQSTFSSNKLEMVQITGSGFTNFEDYPRRTESEKPVWYGNGVDWDLRGGRTHFDHWWFGMGIPYMDGSDYCPFESDED